MRVSRNNQPPVRPEKSDNREKRRQKACAFRTFKRALILSRADYPTAREEPETDPRCLSIQIDTFPAVTTMTEDLSETGSDYEIISCDETAMTEDRTKRCRYSAGQHLNKPTQTKDRTRRFHYRNAAGGRQNA
jgi:hypothetical protein